MPSFFILHGLHVVLVAHDHLLYHHLIFLKSLHYRVASKSWNICSYLLQFFTKVFLRWCSPVQVFKWFKLSDSLFACFIYFLSCHKQQNHKQIIFFYFAVYSTKYFAVNSKDPAFFSKVSCEKALVLFLLHYHLVYNVLEMISMILVS